MERTQQSALFMHTLPLDIIKIVRERMERCALFMHILTLDIIKIICRHGRAKAPRPWVINRGIAIDWYDPLNQRAYEKSLQTS